MINKKELFDKIAFSQKEKQPEQKVILSLDEAEMIKEFLNDPDKQPLEISVEKTRIDDLLISLDKLKLFYDKNDISTTLDGHDMMEKLLREYKKIKERLIP